MLTAVANLPVKKYSAVTIFSIAYQSFGLNQSGKNFSVTKVTTLVDIQGLAQRPAFPLDLFL